MFKRGISLFLCCLMIFSLLSNVIVSVYAQNNNNNGQQTPSAQSTAVSFINFYGNGGGSEVSMDAMTTQDYYVMAVYMSNWFKPGETTLADLLMDGSTPSDFFTKFSDSVGKKDDATLMAVVQALANDFANAIDSGSCTLVDKDNKAITGVDFMYSMMSTVDNNGIIESNKMWRKSNDGKDEKEEEDKPPTQWQLKSDYSKLYYGSNSNITFDFSLPAYKAAIQTVFSYRPDLFLSAEGIVSLERLFVDAVGNIWGLTEIDDPSRSSNSNYNPDLSTTAGCVGSNYDKVYLILPACLNPSAFSVNVKASNLNAAKFPIINRFAMSAIVNANDYNPDNSYSTNMVPIYNLLANTTGRVTNRLLNIFGIHSLSGYLFDTGSISESSSDSIGDWNITNRRETLANFISNPNSIALEIGNTDNIAAFGSTAGIVVSVNPYALEPYTRNSNAVKKGQGNISIDISTGVFNNKAFEFSTVNMKVLKDGSMETLKNGNQNNVQKFLALYMCTPTFLNFNNVSMSLYDDALTLDTDDRILSFADTLMTDGNLKLKDSKGRDIEMGGSGLSALNGATLQGFSLFTNDYTFTLPIDDGDTTSTYVYFSATDNGGGAKSLFWKLLENSRNGTHEDYDKAKEIAEGRQNSGYKLLDALFLHENANYNTLKEYLMPDSNGNLGQNGGLDAIVSYNSLTSVDSIKTLEKIPLSLTSSVSWTLNVMPQGIANLGSSKSDVALGATLGYKDDDIRKAISSVDKGIVSKTNFWGLLPDNTVYQQIFITKSSYTALCDYLLALYGYRILNPSDYFDTTKGTSDTFTTLLGSTEKKDIENDSDTALIFNTNYFQGMYLGYLVDTCGISNLGTTSNGEPKIDMGSFNSAGLLPKYNISASGGTMSARGSNSGTGVEKSEDLSFEEKQKDLINRIYGLTNDSNNDYRNNLIKNIIEGFFLTVHRTITGTWGSKIGTISTGSSNTYDSLAGFIYTPTLEELSFTATLMNNYIKIYVFCMLLLIFLLVLMVLLHMRTWQQGLLTLMFMSVGLLFPYVLISNTINIGNRVANNIYSDRFDFWAMSEHLQSEISLQGYDYLSASDQWLLSANVTSDDTYNGQPGVKVRWMSPKKVDVFNNLYSDANLSEAFVTNTQIFKWLFSSLIYDSEFEDANVNASYVYRPYNSLALEAKSYYAWGQALMKTSEYSQSDIPVTLVDGTGAEDDSLNVKPVVAKFNNILVDDKTLAGSSIGLLAGVGRLHSGIYQLSTLSMLNYSVDKYAALEIVSQFDYKDDNKQKIEANQIGTWGLYSDAISTIIAAYRDKSYLNNLDNPGIYSNLPQDSISHTAFDNADGGEIGTAIYLKNTESPFYYFYSVLKTRYSDNGEGFKNALLNKDIFKVSNEVNNKDLKKTFIMNKSVSGMYRDFLDLEGLFEFVIPQLKAGNDYVKDWQSIHGTEIESYAFEYEIDDTTGDVVKDSEGVNSNGDNLLKDATDKEVQDYKDAVKRKNAMNRIWNMYCPWVDSLYDMDAVVGQKVSVGGRNLVIDDTLDPSAYLVKGRPMIFSEADMAVKGYSYKDLTHVERRLQAVTEKTYKDLMYLVNYYDMDDEVLLVAAAMYATFNFNSEFSQDKFLADSVVMYPQGFELKNFNYDAYMRLALLNSTGETVFATDDLYTRILAKTSLFTGILLLLCDVLACIAIPMIKFVILVGLLFLGILICIACVVNPPDKIFEAISKSVVLPTFLFMVLNITFAYVMSFIVGEGLTTYVGSKSINFATNDPTITLLVMSLLSMAYLVCAWKVIKFLIDAYKKFGMSTAIAAVGIVGAAVAHGAAGMAKKATGATVGALTAEKGNRLAGAFEGAHSGAGGVIDRRIRDKRMKGMLGGQGAGGSSMTESIDKKASTMGSDDIGSSKKPTFNSEYDKAKAEMEPKEGAGSTRVSRAVNQVNRLGHKAASRFKDVASGVGKVGFTAAHLPTVVGHKVSKYANKTLEDISNENKALKTASESMSNARFDSGVKYRQNAVSEQKYQKIASKTAAKAAAKEIKRTSKEYAKETKNVKYDRK